jgi:hypothetical protein
MALNIRPEGKGCDAWFVNKVEDIGGDGGVYPVDEAVVNLAPFGVALGCGRRRADMGVEAEFAEDGFEAATPLAVVGCCVVKNDGM